MCADLKNRRGCGPGSKHEKFMEKNCRKTCGLCGRLTTRNALSSLEYNADEKLENCVSVGLLCI